MCITADSGYIKHTLLMNFIFLATKDFEEETVEATKLTVEETKSFLSTLFSLHRNFIFFT